MHDRASVGRRTGFVRCAGSPGRRPFLWRSENGRRRRHSSFISGHSSFVIHQANREVSRSALFDAAPGVGKGLRIHHRPCWREGVLFLPPIALFPVLTSTAPPRPSAGQVRAAERPRVRRRNRDLHPRYHPIWPRTRGRPRLSHATRRAIGGFRQTGGNTHLHGVSGAIEFNKVNARRSRAPRLKGPYR